MPQTLDKIARDLRGAILAADPFQAERLTIEYRDELVKVWLSMSDSERAVSMLPQKATELLTWARGMAIVHRAMLVDQMIVLDRAIRYTSNRAPARRSTIQVSF
jgi:hypothetical protein